MKSDTAQVHRNGSSRIKKKGFSIVQESLVNSIKYIYIVLDFSVLWDSFL
jgi:hypothetical protein